MGAGGRDGAVGESRGLKWSRERRESGVAWERLKGRRGRPLRKKMRSHPTQRKNRRDDMKRVGGREKKNGPSSDTMLKKKIRKLKKKIKA